MSQEVARRRGVALDQTIEETACRLCISRRAARRPVVGKRAHGALLTIDPGCCGAEVRVEPATRAVVCVGGRLRKKRPRAENARLRGAVTNLPGPPPNPPGAIREPPGPRDRWSFSLHVPGAQEARSLGQAGRLARIVRKGSKLRARAPVLRPARFERRPGTFEQPARSSVPRPGGFRGAVFPRRYAGSPSTLSAPPRSRPRCRSRKTSSQSSRSASSGAWTPRRMVTTPKWRGPQKSSSASRPCIDGLAGRCDRERARPPSARSWLSVSAKRSTR